MVGGGVRRSDLWRVFRVTDRAARIAQCTICFKDLSFRGTTSNLAKHMRRLHPDLDFFVNSQHKDQDRRVQGTLQRRRSEARVLLCPHTGQQLCRDDKPDDHEQMEEIYLEPEYQEEDTMDCKPTIQRKHKPFASSEPEETPPKCDPRRVAARHDRQHPAPALRGAPPAADSSLDVFGTYVASLMKRLPKKVSCKLQMDIVTMILNAELSGAPSDGEQSRKCESPKRAGNGHPCEVTHYEEVGPDLTDA